MVKADAAMYEAKRNGRGRHHVIDLREALHTTEHHTFETDLRSAFAHNRLDLAYQPIVRSASGAVTGVEALLRWTDPGRGSVPPVAIVAVAEQSRLINEIGSWVLERSCRDHAGWLERHPGIHLDLAVNVSARQLMTPGFSAGVAGSLERTGMDPTALVLEMTEHILIEDSDRAMGVLADLKDLGVRIALDDFGTGYSSLSYLRRLPIDILKIDQSFITDIGHAPTGPAIVAAVTDLAHVIGMTVTAEGVETPSQREGVAEIGCDSAQGYYFGRPMSARYVDSVLATTGSPPALPAGEAAQRVQ
jgi:EAL domain-containing protein (putative c-di-GMP-specific phosphodiesterase class I)